MTITKTGYAILGILSISPMSGYDMQQLIRKSTAHFWSESDGQLYPTLTSLTKGGFIRIVATEKTDTRGKKTYALTNTGRKALQSWLELEPETKVVRNEFMLKLFFGANVAADITLQHTETHLHQAKLALQQLKLTQKEIQQNDKASPNYLYWQLSVDYGIKMNEAKIAWCHEVIKQLKHK